MTGNRWLVPLVIGALALTGCAEQEADDMDAGLDTDPGIAADTGMTADTGMAAQDTGSADLATWNTDADARLAPDEFEGWIEEQAFYADWNTDDTEGLSAEEIGAGLITVVDANDDGSINQSEWEDVGADIVGGDAAFDDLDADGSGSIEEAEMVTALEEGDHWSEWDGDGNGTLDESEFNAAVFGIWDTNDDDYIDETEWQAQSDLW